MTQCSMPPALDAVELAMHNAGDAERATVAHLAQCDFCRAQAEALAHMEGTLADRLFRIDCPDADELREFHFGFLAYAQMAAVSQHLRDCPQCMRELARLAEYLTEEHQIEVSPPDWLEAWQDRVRAVVAEWLPRAGAGLATGMSGVRGEIAGDFTIYQAGSLQIGLQVQEARGPNDLRNLFGVLWGIEWPTRHDKYVENDDEKDGEPAGWQAHLWQAGRLHSICPVDDLGSFQFSGLHDAPYEVILAGPDLVVRIESRPAV